MPENKQTITISEQLARKRGFHIKGWNIIKCDICGYSQDLKKTPQVQFAREEARALGWKTAEGQQTLDLCPNCRGLHS